jgi:hypothetical protein
MIQMYHKDLGLEKKRTNRWLEMMIILLFEALLCCLLKAPARP